ncbi:MAG: GIY-YIG nuclease family protein [Pseudomonadota bacterium]
MDVESDNPSEPASSRSESDDRAQKRWAVYLLKCADGSLYAGITTDLNRRLRQHNGELVGGAAYTGGRRPVTLSWCEFHPDRSSAQVREAQIKKLSRREKQRLIQRGD